MFVEGVYLPSNKLDKTKHNVCTAKIEDITKRLVDTVDSPQPQGQLARQIV
jgi:hypothetical protein